MLEVTATNRPTAAMILEDTWLCMINESPSKKMKNRLINRGRSLDGEVQIKGGGKRRHSSSWGHAEGSQGQEGRRKSREDMEKLLNNKKLLLSQGGKRGSTSNSPTPGLTPSISLTSVDQNVSAQSSQKIPNIIDNGDNNHIDNDNDDNDDNNDNGNNNTDDSGNDAVAAGQCSLIDSDSPAHDQLTTSSPPSSTPSPPSSTPSPCPSALSLQCTTRYNNNNNCLKASKPLLNKDLGVGSGVGTGTGTVTGEVIEVKIKNMNKEIEEEEEKKNINEIPYDAILDAMASHCTTSSSPITTSSSPITTSSSPITSSSSPITTSSSPITTSSSPITTPSPPITTSSSSVTQQIISSPQRACDDVSHQLLESNSFSPIDAVKECSSCKNIPNLFNDLASILALDADDSKDEDRGRDRDRDNVGVVGEEVARMGKRSENRSRNTDEDREEEDDGDDESEQVDDKNKCGDKNKDMDGDGDGDGEKISNPDSTISRKNIVMG